MRDGYCDCAEPADYLGANWPETCRETLRVHLHPSFETHRAFAGVDFRAICRQALDAWEEVIDVRFTIEDTYDPPRSEIFFHPHPFPSSVLADAQLAQNRCDTSLRGRYDTTVTWRAPRLFSTLVHEIGHHLGLRHDSSPQASLYYSINADWKKPHARDIAQAVRLGYTKGSLSPSPPQTPDPGPPPQPEPPKPEPPAPPPTAPKPERPRMFEGILGKLMEFLMESLLQDCLKAHGREATVTTAKRRGRLGRRILKGRALRFAREENGRRWARQHKDELFARVDDEIDNALEAEIEAMIDEAAAQEYEGDDD